ENNTFWTVGLLRMGPTARNVTVAATGNVFDFRPVNFNTVLPLVMWDGKMKILDWRPHAKWEGKRNLYVIHGAEFEMPGWPKEKTAFAAWNKFLPEPEEGSVEAPTGKQTYAFSSFAGPELPARLAALAADARKGSGLAEVGPDHSLVGPG